ncbi:hypothetical protein GCM10010245_89480 [Streptomyces spectabilis]|nr:hypothetical protein GCM10010245_89480 [Streptomyces spectabilis]
MLSIYAELESLQSLTLYHHVSDLRVYPSDAQRLFSRWVAWLQSLRLRRAEEASDSSDRSD